MRIVLIGGGSGLAGALLDHLHREGNEMYWISPTKPSASLSFNLKCTHFPFRANDAGIPFILESIQADVAIHLGAFDDTLRFDGEAGSGERLMSDLSSLMEIVQRHQIGKFLFLSSEEVFGDGMEGIITEEDRPRPNTSKGEFLASAEQMLGVFATTGRCKMLVARLSSVYGPQVSMPGEPDYIAEMAHRALAQQEVLASSGVSRQPTYITDAVRGIYALLTEDAVAQGTYNIAGTEEITDAEVAEMVARAMPGAKIAQSDRVATLHLSPDRLMAVSSFVPQQRLEAGIAQTIEWARREGRKAAPETKEEAAQAEAVKQETKSMFRSVRDMAMPYLENMLLLALAAVVSYFLQDHPQFGKVNFIMVYVIIVAAIHGKLQGAVATLLGTGVHLLFQADSGNLIVVMLRYGQFFETGIMFALGMLVGNVRDQLRQAERNHTEEMEHQREQYNELMTINQANVSIKESLEQRLLSYGDSFAKIISIISELDMMEPQRVVQAAMNVVIRIMRTNDVAIYVMAERGGYARLAVASSQEARAMGKSVRLADYPLMNEELEQRNVFVNRGLAQEYPLMAAPVMVGTRMVNVIMVWGIEFERLSQYSVNLLTVVARLISSSADRAYRYNQAVRSERYLPGTDIMNAEAFAEMLNTLGEGKERGMQEFTLLALAEDMVDSESKEDISLNVSKLLRDSDMMGVTEDGRVLLLLSNTSAEDAQFVVRRFENAGLHVQVVSEPS